MSRVITAIKLMQDHPRIKTIGESWFYHILPALAAEPFTPSATDLVNRLKCKNYSIEGQEIPGKLIVHLMKMISETNRGDLVRSQTKTPNISCAVPWVLYAYKHQHGIPYEKWDKSDPQLRGFLGKDLSWLVDPVYSEMTLDWTYDELLEIRLTASTEKKSGLHKGYTAYKMVDTRVKEFDALPKLMRFFILQTWIYHPSIRSQHAILNMKDWDALPEYSLDEGELPSALTTSVWDEAAPPDEDLAAMLDKLDLSAVKTGRFLGSRS